MKIKQFLLFVFMVWLNGFFVYTDFLILGRVRLYSIFIMPIFIMIGLLITKEKLNEEQKHE